MAKRKYHRASIQYIMCRKIFACIILFFNLSVFADEESRSPISVNADYAERDEKTGQTRYEGNVEITHGKIKIYADTVEIQYKNKKASSMLCKGFPSSFEYSRSDQELVSAKAKQIEYSIDSRILSLKNEAALENNGTLIKGDSIKYDLKSETWQAKGGNEFEDRRIQLLIPAVDNPAKVKVSD